MKKIYSILILFVFVLTLTSCKGNEVEPNKDKFVLDFPSEFKEYLPYDEIPNFTFEFDGTINTIVGVSLSNSKIFSNNDDFILSEIIAEFLAGIEEDRLTIREINKEEKYETKMNTLEPDKNGELNHKSHVMKVHNGEVFEEIALISLDSGLTLSFYYRRFVSDYEGSLKTYYAWSYRTLMEIYLHYPLMLHKDENGDNEFLIIPLPENVDYHLGVSRQLPLENLLKDDEYLKERYRSFYYPDYSSDPSDTQEFDLEDNIQQVKEFYIRDHNGIEENGTFKFTYKGYNYKVTFKDVAFTIDIIE